MAQPTTATLIKPWRNHPKGTKLESLSGRTYRDLMLMGVIKDTRKGVKKDPRERVRKETGKKVTGSPADKEVKGSPATK